MAEQIDENLAETVPKTLSITRKVGGRYWLAGVGPRPARVMMVTPCVTDEEAAEQEKIGYERYRQITPRMTNCAQWNILKKIALKEGLDIERDVYVTSIIKYLPEKKQHRSKPLKSMLDQCMPLLEWEIEQVKPEIIVCVGKLSFDLLSDKRLAESDVIGYWDRSSKYNCLLYPTLHISQTLKAEKSERYVMDMRAVARMLENLSGKGVPKMDVNGIVVHDSKELRNLVRLFEIDDAKVLSVDCEWGGQIHVDGHLRSLQIAWSPTDAAYIRFQDDNDNYVFDVSYKEAGAILAEWCDRDDVKYIGHHVSADLTWMAHWLGLKWYKKAIFDTEFALQCVDEASSLGLDILALMYTDFGKYDIDLIRYRKEKELQEHGRKGSGYELIPDDILVPYGLRDVLTVFRAWPILAAGLEKQGLTKYYDEICNPFVTDMFTYWCLKGIPVDKVKLEEMRDLYNWAKVEIEKDFRSAITMEAEELFRTALEKDGHEGLYDRVVGLLAKDRVGDATSELKRAVGAAVWPKYEKLFEHYLKAPAFNIRSQPQMRLWLFDVKRYTPLKSTANKEAGMPAVDWTKVLTYPPEKQATFTPAIDKGSLEILAQRNQDKVLDKLLELNAVGNLCKAFLKPADIDPDTGELVKENGVAYWIGSDEKIHLNHSTTSNRGPSQGNLCRKRK